LLQRHSHEQPLKLMMEPIDPSVWRRASRNTARSFSAGKIASGKYHG
jgi:hypothetical protein